MYTAFFGLREEPFRLTPDPRFFHLADPHRVVLETLLRGVLTRKGFILLTGPAGTGKTTVLHAALQILLDKSFNKAELLSAFIVNPLLTRDEFFEMLLEEFEVVCNSTSKPRRLMALQQKFLDAQRRGTTAVLLIDEAHLLSPELLEEVRLLGNTDTYREKLVQIVLCGQPELVTVLSRPEYRALRQRVACTGHLRPLSLPQTRAYIAERLHAAGLNGPSPFSGTSVESIHYYSGGVPRVINLICDSCLWRAFQDQQRYVRPDLVEAAHTELGLGTWGTTEAPQATEGAPVREAPKPSEALTSREAPAPPEEPTPIGSPPQPVGKNGSGASVVESLMQSMLKRATGSGR